MSNLYTLVGGQQTDGVWVHTGRLTISRKLNNGVLQSVTLPDDWATITVPDGSITSAKIADGTIQAIDLADGAVTSAKILDGSIQNVDMAAGAAAANVGTLSGVLGGTLPSPTMAAGAAATNVGTLGGVLNGTLPNPGMAANVAISNITVGQISFCIGTKNLTTDQWSNASLAAFDNQLPGSAGILTASSLDAADMTFVNINVAAQLFGQPTAVWAGWSLYVDGSLVRHGPKIWAPSGGTTGANWSGLFLVAGPGTLVGALSAGSHTFELRFYVSAALASGAYLRPASAAYTERYAFEVFQIRK